MAQARREGTFTSEHDAFWSTARHALGDPEGTRELVDDLDFALLAQAGQHEPAADEVDQSGMVPADAVDGE